MPAGHHEQMQQKAANATPYAGQQSRQIKSLSAEETKGWQDGQGMGLAKAAELNGYPGPMHSLELKDALQLNAEQISTTQQLMAKHKAEVSLLGKQLVEMEGHLDQAFAQKTIDATSIDRMTAHIASIQGKIRASHLKTHLLQTALLSPTQVKQYNTVRGYGE